MATAFSFTEENIGELAWLVEAHQESFIGLYGAASVTPKMHFMLHLPSQIKRFCTCMCVCIHLNTYILNNYSTTYTIHRFGPLRQMWCMRFEGKNKQMKSYLHGNFKNVPFSVATRHQEWLCAQLMTKQFLTLGDCYSGTTCTCGL